MRKTKILTFSESASGLAFCDKMLLSALDRERFEACSISRLEDAQGYATELNAAGLSADVSAMSRERETDFLNCHGIKAGLVGRAAGRILSGAAKYRQTLMPLLKRVAGRKGQAYRALQLIWGRFGGKVTSIMKRMWGGLRRLAAQPRISRLIAVCSGIVSEPRQFGFLTSNIPSIPHGVDAERLGRCCGPDEKACAKRALGLPNGTLFPFTGRFARQRRLPLLLQARPRFRARRPVAALLFAGANKGTTSEFKVVGSEAETVLPHVLEQDGVRLPGLVDYMPFCLRARDVCVLPLASERPSNTLLEAGASRLAASGSNIGGIEDLVEDDQSGRPFTPDNLDDRARALSELGLNTGLRQTLVGHAVETIRKRFDIRQTAERLLAALTAWSSPRTPAPVPALNCVARTGGARE